MKRKCADFEDVGLGVSLGVAQRRGWFFMFQTLGIRIGRILGIPIYLDFSWILIFALVTLSLGLQFTKKFAQSNPLQQWGLGILTSLLFFGSVVFHELAHSAVAQHYKIKVLSITLFLFGGLARIGREPTKAIQEFNIAIAGPLSSGLLAAIFYAIALVSSSNPMAEAVCLYLAGANGLL